MLFSKIAISFSYYLTYGASGAKLFNVMENLFEILKLVEASVQSDRQKAVAYTGQLADKLERSGESKAADRIRRVLSSAQSAVMPSSVGITERPPVDSESRLNLADVTMINPAEVELFLPPGVRDIIDEFLRYVSAADKLLEEGLGISPSLLLYGPPGCGKTELAKLIAGQLRLPLVTARTDALISSYLGSTAKNLRMLFDYAASKPCVLFLDEFDAIAKLRDDQHELGELKRVVVSLLQNIDAVQGQSVLLAATNHEHLLDSAIWRRFAYRIHLDRPDADARFGMFVKFLNTKMDAKKVARLAEASDGFSGSDIRQICEAARREAVLADADTSESQVLHRILLRSLNGEQLCTQKLILRAKEQYSHVYTHRVLAEMFNMSPGNVTHILKKYGEGNNERREQITD
jgi:SpoVK/Ycf46/Vps4 family AAA+-type ATPase